MTTKLQIGEYVYHKDLYDYRESFKVVGIRENEVELEGDFSAEYNVIQKQWMPIHGTSRIYNYRYKLDCRERSMTCLSEIQYIDKEIALGLIKELSAMVYRLTQDAELNPEF